MATIGDQLNDVSKARLKDLFHVHVDGLPEITKEDEPFRYLYDAMRNIIQSSFEIPRVVTDPVIKYNQSIFLKGYIDYQRGVTDESPCFVMNVAKCNMPTLHVNVKDYWKVTNLIDKGLSGREVLSEFGVLPPLGVDILHSDNLVKLTPGEQRQISDCLNVEFATKLVIQIGQQIIFLMRKPKFIVNPKQWGVFARSIVWV